MNTENINTGDYQKFDDGAGTVSSLCVSIEDTKQEIIGLKSQLINDSVFMGPIADSCGEGFSTTEKGLATDIDNFKTISSYLTKCKENYQNADDKSKELYLTIKDGKITETTSKSNVLSGNIKFSENIPDNLSQRGYTVTCYGKEG